MEKIIYSKCSNDRADEFNIITQIVMDDSNEKRVVKKSSNNRANAHVKKIVENYMKLSVEYEGTRIKFAKAVEKNNTAEIEWVIGNNFAVYLDGLLEQEKIDECIAIMKDYFSEMFRRKETDECLSQQFYDVFGVNDVEDCGILVKGVDIDILFSNVIYNEGKWIDYDYEWVMNFAFPEKYVIYRCLLYYITNVNRSKLLDAKIYEEFQISMKEQTIFKKMEENFQRYIEKNHTPMWKLYQDIHGKVIDIKPIEERLKRKEVAQIFYDFGNGYSETDSESMIIDEERKNQYSVSFEIPQDVKGVRFDPVWSACIVEVNKIIDENGEECTYITNGMNFSENKYIFLHDDPQVIISDVVGKKQLYIDYNLVNIDCEDEESLRNIDAILWDLVQKSSNVPELIKKIELIETEKESYKIQNQNLRTQNEDLEKYVDKLEGEIKELMVLRDDLLEVRDGLAQVQKDLTFENEQLKNELQLKKIENANIQGENEALQEKLSDLNLQKEALDSKLMLIENSMSWKITKPMRYLEDRTHRKGDIR